MSPNDRASTEVDREAVVLREALAASRRLAFTSGAMVHGFKNQLTVVLGHVQLALDAAEQGLPPDPQSLEAIRRAANQGVGFSRQLLDLARTPSPRVTTLEPGPVLERVIALAATMIPGPVHLEVEDDLVALRGNPLRVEQSLVDLVLNARDALAEDFGSVVIGYRRVQLDEVDPRTDRAGVAAGSYGMLWVADDGPGMDSDVLSRAGELFFTTKPPGDGSGVGLAVVRGVAERAGGGLLIDSVPGVGTTVAVLLPEADVPVEDEPAAPRRRPFVDSPA